MTARVRSLVIALAVLPICAGVAACNSSPRSKAVPAPRGLPGFYAVPEGASSKSPGTLLKSEAVAAPETHGSVRRIMYVSTDTRSRSVAVTGLVFVPAAPPPPGGYSVVSWAHGTNGMADQCAPSLQPETALPPAAVNGMLGLGWVVVATDYQGEGTPPGLLPFLVGDVAAHNTIDIVLAARKLPSVRTSKNYVVWGHSEGGQSALFAWKLATTYGSRSGLHMVGAVAVAPPSNLPAVYQFLSTTTNGVYDYMMLAGFNVGYGNGAAPLGAVLTPKGAALLPALRQGCLAAVASTLSAYSFDQLVKSSPFDVPGWKRLLTQNDPANFGSANKVPLLVVHGEADEVIPVATSGQLAAHLCTLGANLERWVYPAQSHAGVLFVSVVDMGRWMLQRFEQSSAHASPNGERGVQVHTCRDQGGR
jgi:dipeptidyl aminopeptidase/acylaminoacyl peptidase